MGWKYSSYKATCADCGREVVCIKGSDDWYRSSTTWEGFKNHAADPNDVGRMRADLGVVFALSAVGFLFGIGVMIFKTNSAIDSIGLGTYIYGFLVLLGCIFLTDRVSLSCWHGEYFKFFADRK
jgi:hypothetical protein